MGEEAKKVWNCDPECPMRKKAEQANLPGPAPEKVCMIADAEFTLLRAVDLECPLRQAFFDDIPIDYHNTNRW